MTTPATSFSFSRVGAMVRRYWYLLRSSWPPVSEEPSLPAPPVCHSAMWT